MECCELCVEVLIYNLIILLCFQQSKYLLAQEVEANNEVHQSITTKITQRRLGPTQESYHF